VVSTSLHRFLLLQFGHWVCNSTEVTLWVLYSFFLFFNLD